MAIVSNVKIISLKALKTFEGKDHVIQEVHWVVESADGEFAHSMGGFSNLTFDKDNFVEWEDSDAFKDTVLGWIKNDTDRIVSICETHVAEQKADNDEELLFSN
ncbi:MAG: hypothetical protein GOVbin962_46 [Prokaryotic dsDNA virus sp.]|nr:MAG: hypothetical protein GOVbin962_46 [Prokaryotic dsDNA virus sp.]|tara:strand:+ start:54185 stop:54496 length:312 start_codon:yes stop_codon:yes gene_type:complete